MVWPPDHQGLKARLSPLGCLTTIPMGLFFWPLHLAQARGHLTSELKTAFQNMLALKLALKEPVQMVPLNSKLLYIYQKMGTHFCISMMTSVLGPKTGFLELRPSKRSKKNHQGLFYSHPLISPQKRKRCCTELKWSNENCLQSKIQSI